jgi:hypothetical protein
MQQSELIDEAIWHVDVTAALLIALLLQQDVIKTTDLESNKRRNPVASFSRCACKRRAIVPMSSRPYAR